MDTAQLAVLQSVAQKGMAKSERNPIMKLVGDAGFLEGLEGVEVDGDNYSLA